MSDEKYIPKSKLAQWFDSRLPLLTLSHHLREYPTPKNLNYWWTFGGILTFFLIIPRFFPSLLGIGSGQLIFFRNKYFMNERKKGISFFLTLFS